MTIKQQGGIFGRNPTFNDIDMQDLTAATGTVSGNLTANALGVGTTTIEGRAIVEGSGVDVRIYNSDAAANGDSTALIRAYKSTGYWNDLRLSGSNIVFDTFTGERARITNDGLTFNGDTAAANALSDYEEGSVSQPLEIGGSNQVDYYTNASQYTKVGNVVTYVVSFDLYNRDLIGTGALKINLPFASFSGTGGEPKIIEEVVYRSASTKTGSPTTSVGAYNLGSGSSYAELYTDNTLGTAISAPDTSERYLFNFVITYRSA